MVVLLGGGGGVLLARYPCKVLPKEQRGAAFLAIRKAPLQGYLAHKKTPSPLGPP